jgi:hypothetical protein
MVRKAGHEHRFTITVINADREHALGDPLTLSFYI